MKRFKFRLEAVLTLRKREETLALEKYALAVQARETATSVLRRSEGELTSARSTFDEDIQRGVSAEKFAWMSEYFTHLESHCESSRKELLMRSEAVKETLGGLMRTKQNREIVDRFRDQQWNRFRQEFQREEEKLIEDLSNGRTAIAGSFQVFRDA